MVKEHSSFQMLINLKQNYEAALQHAIAVCSFSGSGNCDAAIQTAAIAAKNLLTAARKTVGGAATLPGTFLGGDIPADSKDLAIGEIQDLIQSEVEREIESQRRKEEQEREKRKKNPGCNEADCPDTPPPSTPAPKQSPASAGKCDGANPDCLNNAQRSDNCVLGNSGGCG